MFHVKCGNIINKKTLEIKNLMGTNFIRTQDYPYIIFFKSLNINNKYYEFRALENWEGRS
jgi:hypothetical protein